MIVLPGDHVVATAGHHKDDGCHTPEAVDSRTAFTVAPPTSNACELTLPTWNLVSKIPEIRMPQQSRSWWLGE